MTAYATTVPVWTALTAYLIGSRVQPVAQDGRVFQATTNGTSGAAEPTWPTNEPWTVVDSGVTWSKGTSARRQMVAGLYAQLQAFQAANPTMLLDVRQVRPASIASMALPGAYIGSRDEQVTFASSVQMRTFTGLQVVVVDVAPDNAQQMARADDLVDALVDWFVGAPHAASGFSVLELSSVAETNETDGPTNYPASVLTFGSSEVQEGRN